MTVLLNSYFDYNEEWTSVDYEPRYYRFSMKFIARLVGILKGKYGILEKFHISP